MLALSVVFFGCSFFTKETPKWKEYPPVPATSSDFEKISEQMQGEFVEWVLSFVPDVNIPDVYTSNFSISGKANLTVPEAETVDFSLISKGSSDFSEENNPKAENTITLSGEMKGEQNGKGTGEFVLKVANKQIIGSLSKAEAFLNGKPFPVEMFVGPYLQKWYGATFDEIDTLMNQISPENASFRIAEAFRRPGEMFLDLKKRLREALNEVHIWKLRNVLPEENGMLRFEVELDKDALQKGLIALAQFYFTGPDGKVNSEAFEQAKTNIENELKNGQYALQGILSVNTSNIWFFEFSGNLVGADGQKGTVKVVKNAEEILVSIDASPDSVLFKKKDGAYSFLLNGVNVLSGTYGDNTLTGTLRKELLFSSMYYNNEEVPKNSESDVSFSLETKGEKEYSAWVNFPDQSLEIYVNDLKYSELAILIDLRAKLDQQDIFSGVVDYKVEKTDTVNISVPEKIESFLNTFLSEQDSSVSSDPSLQKENPSSPDEKAPVKSNDSDASVLFAE